MSPRGFSLRVRLTLVYGGLIVLAGGAVLALTYVSLADALSGHPGPAVVFQQRPQQSVPTGGDDAAVKREVAAETERVQAQFRGELLSTLRTRGAVLLAGLAVVGLWGGWVLAGSALRPMRHITTSARRIASRDVRGRLNWGGPHDEARELADTFDDMLARLEEAVDDQWRFVANASHELKTPLAVNRTLLEVAMGRPDAPPDLRRLGETLLEVNARHERLIDGLLTLARSEHAVARPVPVDLADIVERVVEIVGPEARRAGVALDVEGGVAPVQGDPGLLERLVLNLVQNAIRYNEPDGWVRVGSGREGSAAWLRVVNPGPEVLAEEVAALFEPFRRLNDRVGSARGTGLGLSIVRSVARAHGGDVVATPRRDGGLEVYVTLSSGQRRAGSRSTA
jgi:signal transduction histidine kinase